MKFLRKFSYRQNGYSMLELVATLTVLSVLVMGSIPLAQNAVKRQKEAKLRETLRDVRNAIDEFKRDTLGACPQGAVASGNPTQAAGNIQSDPRSRVVVDDCKIFETDNLDRYPPSIETLVEGSTSVAAAEFLIIRPRRPSSIRQKNLRKSICASCRLIR